MLRYNVRHLNQKYRVLKQCVQHFLKGNESNNKIYMLHHETSFILLYIYNNVYYIYVYIYTYIYIHIYYIYIYIYTDWRPSVWSNVCSINVILHVIWQNTDSHTTWSSGCLHFCLWTNPSWVRLMYLFYRLMHRFFLSLTPPLTDHSFRPFICSPPW